MRHRLADNRYHAKHVVVCRGEYCPNNLAVAEGDTHVLSSLRPVLHDTPARMCFLPDNNDGEEKGCQPISGSKPSNQVEVARVYIGLLNI